MSAIIADQLEYLPRLPRDKSVGIGCIGAGFIMADCQLVAYRQAGFNPIAIAARRRDQAEAVAIRHQIPMIFTDYREMLACPDVKVVDIAVPPDVQFEVIREIVRHAGHVRGVAACSRSRRWVEVNYSCRGSRDCATLSRSGNHAGRQSEHAVRPVGPRVPIAAGSRGSWSGRAGDDRHACHSPLDALAGRPRLGDDANRMSIHHLDTFRFWFGDPVRVFASVRPDPRTKFAHEDGIALYILEYANGLRAMSCDDVWAGPSKEGAAADIGIRWRIEGTTGMARGTIGWPSYPELERPVRWILYHDFVRHEWIQPQVERSLVSGCQMFVRTDGITRVVRNRRRDTTRDRGPRQSEHDGARRCLLQIGPGTSRVGQHSGGKSRITLADGRAH